MKNDAIRELDFDNYLYAPETEEESLLLMPSDNPWFDLNDYDHWSDLDFEDLIDIDDIG